MQQAGSYHPPSKSREITLSMSKSSADPAMTAAVGLGQRGKKGDVMKKHQQKKKRIKKRKSEAHQWTRDRPKPFSSSFSILLLLLLLLLLPFLLPSQSFLF
jgi:hypothetical protein